GSDYAEQHTRTHELGSPEGNTRSDFHWWKCSRLGRIPGSRIRRSTFIVQSLFLNWGRARWTACFIAITAIIHPAQSQQTKPAEPFVAASNRAVQSQLPFSDRQDFEDATRGFIATTPDPNNPNRYAFLKQEAPPTVNP